MYSGNTRLVFRAFRDRGNRVAVCRIRDIHNINRVWVLLLILVPKSKKENPIQAPFNLGYTIFFFTQVLNQMFFIPDAFSDALYSYMGQDIILYVIDETVFTFGLAMQLAYMFLLFSISFVCILFPFEKYIQNSKKYPLSVILFLSIAMSAIVLIFGNIYIDVGSSGNDIMFAILGIVHPIAALIILLGFIISLIGALTLYFRLAKQTSGVLRKKSLATAIGLLIWFLSVIVGNALRAQLEDLGIPYSTLIGPALFYAGTILLAYGFQRK